MPTLAEIEYVGPTGGYNFDSGSSGFGMDRRYEVDWVIQLRDNNTDWFYEPRLLLLDSRIPQYLDPYTSGTAGAPYSDPYALLRTGRITKVDTNRCRVNFTLVYTTLPIGDQASNVGLNSPLADVFPTATPPTGGPSGGSGDPAGDPTQLAPRFQYGYETIEDLFLQEVDGGAFVQNTAYDEFEPAPTKPTVIRTLTTTRYETKWEESKWDDYCFVTNQFVWRGNANGACLMFPPTVGDYVIVGGTLFYPVTYLIKIKIKGNLDWDLRLDSYGFRELIGGKSKPIARGGGNVTKPWPLKASGLGLTEAELASGVRPEQLQFVKYEQRDFDALNLILPAPL